MNNFGSIERLLEKAIGAQLNSLQSGAPGITSSNHDDLGGGIYATGSLNNSEALGYVINMRRKVEVADNYINILFFQQVERSTPRFGLEYSIIRAQCPIETAADGAIVVNDQNCSLEIGVFSHVNVTRVRHVEVD